MVNERAENASEPAADNSSSATVSAPAKANIASGDSITGDSGLVALAMVAAYYRVAVDPVQLSHDLGLGERQATGEDVVRAARITGLKSTISIKQTWKRLASVPMPVVLGLKDGTFAILVGRQDDGSIRVLWPQSRQQSVETVEAFAPRWSGQIIFVTRRAGGAGVDPTAFGLRWFIPSLWRYRKPLSNVLLASLFIQLFALITPLFFQVIIDKVLVHRGTSTLIVIVIGMLAVGAFDAMLQYLRSYALSHTASRIDVELGARLFDHLTRLPLTYFETRAAGQTVARMRELDSIRGFLTGHGLSSVIDLLFTVVFIAVLYMLSSKLTLIVILSIPCYVVTAWLIRPILKQRIEERFNRGAVSQQFLVETVIGIQTVKSAAVEPILRNEWEEKLAAYVRTSFLAGMLITLGQNVIQFISRTTTAIVIYVGALAVMSGDLTVGGLVAFNMIMSQTIQPILRLSQLWQDFQQVQVSVDRLGDIMNAMPESRRLAQQALPPAEGAIRFKDVGFRYVNGGPPILQAITLDIPAGQSIGIVGTSGSGKSTLTKLVQRLYLPERGQIFVDGNDISQVDTAWLRRQIGVVLQDNLLFKRTIHDNIALANPGLPRALVTAAARLAGADEFISRMPLGYDTVIEERGSNLSAGQRQRIAIARALVTRPRILIMDEATSALDYESERIIQANMANIVRGRTVIIIAHRLNAVRDCTRIIAVNEGRIVEDGTHQDLISRHNGVYAKLWRLQNEMHKP